MRLPPAQAMPRSIDDREKEREGEEGMPMPLMKINGTRAGLDVSALIVQRHCEILT